MHSRSDALPILTIDATSFARYGNIWDVFVSYMSDLFFI